MSKNKIRFFSRVTRITQPKNQVPRSKGVLCSLVTDRHESEYRGHPFMVSRMFPSTYHQGSVQYVKHSGCILLFNYDEHMLACCMYSMGR